MKNKRSPVRIPETWGRVYRIYPYFNVAEIHPTEDSKADKLLHSLYMYMHDDMMIGEQYKVLKERRRSRIGVD